MHLGVEKIEGVNRQRGGVFVGWGEEGASGEGRGKRRLFTKG